MNSQKAGVICLALIALSGCSSKLSRPEALVKIKNKLGEQRVIRFQGGPSPACGSGDLFGNTRVLARAGFLASKRGGSVVLTAKGYDAFKSVGARFFPVDGDNCNGTWQVPIGTYKDVEVTGVSEDETTAIVEYSYTIDPNEIGNHFLFHNNIEPYMGLGEMGSIDFFFANDKGRAVFKKYDDGWRLVDR